MGKGEIACTSNFSFSHNVFLLYQRQILSILLHLSSANAFNLVWSKILLCGNGLSAFSGVCILLQAASERFFIIADQRSAKSKYRHNDSYNNMVFFFTLYKTTKFWTCLKEFSGDKINVSKKFKFLLGKVRKHCGKRRKCWLPAFSPFPTMFPKGFFLKIVNSWDCVVKSFTVCTKLNMSLFVKPNAALSQSLCP